MEQLLAFVIFYILSCFTAFCLSNVFIGKKDENPVQFFHENIKFLLEKLNIKYFSNALECFTCFSFWAALLTDLVFCFIALCLGFFYFAWPISGLLVSGFSFYAWELINALDTQDQDDDEKEDEEEDEVYSA